MPGLSNAASFLPLGDLPGGSFGSGAYGISADGSVVVGFGDSGDSGDPVLTEAFRWTSGGGIVGLGELPGGGFGSVAYAVSADGGVVVGDSADLSNRSGGGRGI